MIYYIYILINVVYGAQVNGAKIILILLKMVNFIGKKILFKMQKKSLNQVLSLYKVKFKNKMILMII